MDWIRVQHEVDCSTDAPHHQREGQDRRRRGGGRRHDGRAVRIRHGISAGAMSAHRNQSPASSVVGPCGSGKKTETCFCWRR
ncbi:hypothetical protein BF49_6138 [Bradyrhizobium sp.]|nr:hypothetical protein BF49_6138 [Bradyrhizobium sp.]